ncbi:MULTISPECIES: carbohydrate ABC transporter permease [unclassified Streptosporangium]|uniref:carbohydrate ABC transporter permease n=1 Tax=unclassified Streptosporangium TaxID=2632669 RepID=UPI002E29B436|nr:MULTISPECIES: sugar ABC transporter permease [unclassified Streptosporangium]
MTLTTSRPRAAAGGPGASPRRRGPGRPGLLPWLFLAPALIIFLYFKYIPMTKGVWLSFFKVQPFLGDEWVGLDNYRQVFTDESFRAAIGHTLYLAVVQTGGAMLIGFCLALLLEGRARTLWFVRSAAFLPVVSAIAVVGEVWRLLYFPAADGMLNNVFGWFGIGPQGFLDDPDSALWWVSVVGIWKHAPYDMMIILAGLAGIDRQLYEQAALDGAGLRQRIRFVTLPALRPVVTILVTLACIRGLRIFTEVFVLTAGGPAGSTDVVMTRIYTLGFQSGDIGFASAASVLLFLGILTLTVCVTLYRRRKEI